MRYYIIAGERSGDLHAGNLVKALKVNDPAATFQGFGGEHMAQHGVTLTVHYRDLAFMGFLEVVANLNKISGFIKQCKADIKSYKPDVVVLVDYGGFNLKIAKFCKQEGIKVFYYITPKVWAWNQGRAWKLKAYVDKMFVILPFEKEFFKKFDWAVDYVGNPVLDAVKAHTPNKAFCTTHGLVGESPVIALLPGSRKQELLKIIPLMGAVARLFPEYQFAVATVSNLDKSMYSPLAGLPNVRFIYDETYDLLLNSNAAIVTSGTATLETALFRVPQVVVYRTSGITYQIAKFFIKVPYISLVNLIAGKAVVKELIQQDANPEKVAAELNTLLADPRRTQVLEGYQEIYNVLDTGSASGNAAALMVSYLKQ